MTDVFSPQKRSSVMRQVKAKNTAPELKVRRLLTRMGLRYRLHRTDLPGKLAIFVNGCFWHGHDCARGARAPKANAAYWQAKIGRNRMRDVEHRTSLEALGWRVLTLWECELKDEAQVEHRLKEELAGDRDRI